METEKTEIVFERHDHVRKTMNENYHRNKHASFESRRAVAIEQMDSCSSYRPGICDSGAGPSGDMGYVPKKIKRNSNIFAVNDLWLCFSDQNGLWKFLLTSVTPLVEVEYLDTSDNHKTFFWSNEPNCWEFMSQILIKLSDPSISRGTTGNR